MAFGHHCTSAFLHIYIVLTVLILTAPLVGSFSQISHIRLPHLNSRSIQQSSCTYILPIMIRCNTHNDITNSILFSMNGDGEGNNPNKRGDEAQDDEERAKIEAMRAKLESGIFGVTVGDSEEGESAEYGEGADEEDNQGELNAQ